MRTFPFACIRMTMIMIAAVVCFTGCGPKEDFNKAKTSVELALASWKKGENAKQLTSQGIEIVDPDWATGHRLLDYTIKNVSSQPQQGPRVVVAVNLQNKAGKKVNTEIAYEVSMKDTVKISRDPFHISP